MIKKTGIKSEH